MKKKISIVVVCMLWMLLGTMPCYASKKATSVTMNYHHYVMKPKTTLSLKAKCLPSGVSQKVTWKSSKSSVASVSSSGKVTAKKSGTATIYAIAKDGSGKKASCKIKVTKSIKRISKISVKVSKKTIYVGESLSAKVTISPKSPTLKSLVWTSSNTKVAAVTQSGKIKGTGAGTAKITAMAQDGSKKKVQITITIKKKQTVPSVKPSTVPTVIPSKEPVYRRESAIVTRSGYENSYCYEMDTSYIPGTIKPAVAGYEVHSVDKQGNTTIYQADADVLNQAHNGLMWGAGLDGKYSKEELKKLLEKGNMGNVLGMFGITSLQVIDSQLTDSTSDYITLEVEKNGTKREVKLDSLKLVSDDTYQTDLSGTKSLATKFWFKLRCGSFKKSMYLELLGNGNTTCIYDGDGETVLCRIEYGHDRQNAQKEFCRISISKSLVNILPNEIVDRIPDFDKSEVYNVYEET